MRAKNNLFKVDLTMNEITKLCNKLTILVIWHWNQCCINLCAYLIWSPQAQLKSEAVSMKSTSSDRQWRSHQWCQRCISMWWPQLSITVCDLPLDTCPYNAYILFWIGFVGPLWWCTCCSQNAWYRYEIIYGGTQAISVANLDERVRGEEDLSLNWVWWCTSCSQNAWYFYPCRYEIIYRGTQAIWVANHDERERGAKKADKKCGEPNQTRSLAEFL